MSGMHRNSVKSEKEKKQNRIRLAFQAGFAVFLNGYLKGFLTGGVFNGKTKALCVPVLNCYSCPGALGSCPIGALQNALGSGKRIPYYVLGTLMLFGVLFGRLVCGFVCPFGFIQDLLHKIPVKKIKVPKKADRVLRFLKYVVLLVFVILLPLLMTDKFGLSAPYFCKWICPAGTLEGGIPLLLGDSSLRSVAGWLFNWKLIVLIVVLIGSVFIHRFFCKYLCPLGAFYALFNKFSFYRLNIDKEKCIDCKKCEQVCPMDVEVTKCINSTECIRCGKCRAACPTEAIKRK
ncbi:MAG: 4Fe-4S binding protein [Clostridiales bacterium]|nr:4Fe-4S binding protein [Clostridiales bacterium]